jgi:hypothetical protein
MKYFTIPAGVRANVPIGIDLPGQRRGLPHGNRCATQPAHEGIPNRPRRCRWILGQFMQGYCVDTKVAGKLFPEDAYHVPDLKLKERGIAVTRVRKGHERRSPG